MLVAGDHHIVVSNVNVRGSLRSTQEADGVESHFKLGTGANEGTAHWFYLHCRTKEEGGDGQLYT